MTEPLRSGWTLELPWQSPPLSLNDRRHHMVVWRQRAAVLQAVRSLVRAAGIPRMDAITVELHYLPAKKRIRDEDNLVATLKPCLDGLRDYPAKVRNGVTVRDAHIGVVADDDPTHVVWGRPVIHPPDPTPRACRLWLMIIEGIDS